MRLVHRVHTRATPAEVWELLGDPAAWPTFDLLRVRGTSSRVSAGQHLLGVLRGLGLRVPLDVLECVPERRLRHAARAQPGVTAESFRLGRSRRVAA